MITKRILIASLIFITSQTLAAPSDAVANAIVNEGYKLELFASGFPRARSLDVSDDGTIAVGTNADQIYLLRDNDLDGQVDELYEIGNLSNPNGVVWLGKDLYVAETTRILKFTNPLESLKNNDALKREVVISGFPSSNHHGRRFIDFDEDNNLYVALGVPCNVCIPPDPELTATIVKINLVAKTMTTFAYGLRNSVGFDWHPKTKEMWATDNGRDWLGDDLPDDELNRIHEEGLHFGFPYCHDKDFSDPKFGDERSCDEFVPATAGLGPHVAALGIHFTKPNASVAPNRALIALHGSWNRSVPIGYSVIEVAFDDTNTKVKEISTFVDGWLIDGETIARPVDIASLADGSVLISDDYNGAIYRVSKIN